MPDRLDYSGSFNYYRSRQQTDDKTDLYPHFFTTDSSVDIEYTGVLSKHDHHGVYADYDYEHYKPFVQKYFGISEKVQRLQNQLVNTYNICFEQTIVVYYRGTDKHTEVKLADPIHYIEAAENLLKSAPESRILIQTDQRQIRDLFVNYFGQKCFYFHEAPVTEGNEGIHTSQVELGINSYDFGLMFLAITGLMSKCRYIINHKGNVAAWMCLFRGHAEGVEQIDADEKLYPVYFDR